MDIFKKARYYHNFPFGHLNEMGTTRAEVLESSPGAAPCRCVTTGKLLTLSEPGLLHPSKTE